MTQLRCAAGCPATSGERPFVSRARYINDRYAMDREKLDAVTAWGRRVEEIVGGGGPATMVLFRLQEKAS